MTTYEEYAGYLQELSRPAPVGDRTKSAIGRAAKAAGLHYWRAFDIWYLKARRIEAREADQIKAAYDNKRELETQDDIDDLRIRFLKLESRIAAERADVRSRRIGMDRSPISARRGSGGPGRGR